jgi:prepilin-type N-terminal cleavage/methylation domain-containing protein
MASHNTSRHDKALKVRGFTLLEVVIVMAIMVIILGFGLFTTLDAYSGFIFRSERNNLVSILTRARSQALNNVNESPHGVCYISPNYILFRGPTCTPGLSTNEVIGGSSAVTVSGISQAKPVVFEQLTGRLIPQISPETKELEIVITTATRGATTSINNLGRINW